MSKKLLFGLFLVILVVAGVFVSSDRLQAPSQTNTVASTPQEAESVTPTDTAELGRSSPTPGQYLDYRDGIIAETTGPKLLFFHASWCRQCRDIEASIAQQGVPKGVSIIKVDYDSADALRKQYKVTLQTTFVKIDDQGNELKKYVAYNEPNIASVRRELL